MLRRNYSDSERDPVASYDVINLINGSGLSGALADDNSYNMWVTNVQ
jgi:hypothetical protein